MTNSLDHRRDIPPGFVIHFIHQCPRNNLAPQASEKWIVSLRDNTTRGRVFRGKDYYDTPDLALDAAIQEVYRRLAHRKVMAKYKKT